VGKLRAWAAILAATSSSALLVGFALSSELRDPIVFQSLESKTGNGGPVFNQVKFIPGWNRDIWLMRQTHEGYDRDYTRWDRLAIVVDKTQRPYRAVFYQFRPGAELRLASESEAAPFKARCFACHANGPRAIRPDGDSHEGRLSFGQKFAISILNLRVKTYGRVNSTPAKAIQGGAPFRSALNIFSRPLGLKTCVRCHSSSGIRNELKLEHLGTARFLVQHGIMPPFPFSATSAERARLEFMTR